jgi:hypothetical protein
MPYFPAVGHIDDNLSPEEVTKEYRRRYSLAAYHKKRELIVDELGRKCETCGATNDLVFVKKPGAPDFKVGQLANIAESVRVTLLEHVYLLCEEHAKQKLYKKGRVTHGTYWSSYKVKCPCEECEEYRANRSLERREERRAKRATLPSQQTKPRVVKPKVSKPAVPEPPKPRRFIPTPAPEPVAAVEETPEPQAPGKYDLTGYVPYNQNDDSYSVPDIRRFR